MFESLRVLQDRMIQLCEDEEFQANLKKIEDETRVRRALKELKLKPLVKVGDIVKVQDCHHFEPHYYEVSSIHGDCVKSQPADYSHWWADIIAVYRFDGRDFKCIWRVEDDQN